MARGQLWFPSDDEPPPEDQIARGLAAVGLFLESGAADVEEEFCLWPECQGAFRFWLAVQTQWVSDSGQRTGLNYAGVQSASDLMGLRKRDRCEYFSLLQSMESAALEEWNRR